MAPPRSYALPKLDAAENLFFARELEHVRAKSYDIKYADRKIRQLVPVDNSVDPGAEVVTYSQYDRVGVANGGEPVRDHERRPAAHQSIERGLHEPLGFGI